MKAHGPRLLSASTQAALHGLVIAVFLSVSFPLAAQQFTGRTGTGVLAPVATVDPLHPPVTRNLALAAPDMTRQRGPRRLHPKTSAPAIFAQTTAAAGVDSVQWASPPANAERSRAVRRNFDGVSSLDSAVTNFGAEFEPPDQGLCVGNGFVLEPVNSAYTIYRSNGKQVAGPFNVNVLFDEGLTEFTSDPRCHFDAATHTWFAVILFISADNTEARTDIAVNTSGDPTKPWTVYHLDATDDGTHGTPAHVGCPCLGDQPLLGIDRDNIYISTNEFSILGPQFNGAQVYAVSKRDLIRGAKNIHFVHFENLTIAGTQAASVQPAINTRGDDDDGVGGVEYFLQSLDPDGTGDNRLGVWALTHPEAVADGDTPTLSRLVINSLAYSVPPNAVQKGAASLLNSGDDRMQQVQFVNGSLWGELNTGINVPGSASQLAANAWFEIRPRVRNSQIAGATIRRQGILASRGNYLLYPALQTSNDGEAVMVFTISGPSLFPSAAFARLSDDQRAFGPITIAAPGTGPYAEASTRWGDYSWAVADPSGDSVWLATEYIPALDRQTPDGQQNWGTRVLQISAGDDEQ